MPTLELTQEEWQALTIVLTKQPWEIANPILYKMANQMRAQITPPPIMSGDWSGLKPLRPDGEDRGRQTP